MRKKPHVSHNDKLLCEIYTRMIMYTIGFDRLEQLLDIFRSKPVKFCKSVNQRHIVLKHFPDTHGCIRYV